MGLLDSLIERFGRARATSRGSALEAQGRLAEAYELYQAAGQGAEASRVMLAQAESEPDPARRIGLLALAASADPGCAAAQTARRRKALLSLDLLRSRPGSLLESEQRALARELEAAGLQREAAEVFGSAGDLDNQARLLAACGAIDALESALTAEQKERISRRGRQQVWNQATDTIALGQRFDAIRMCESWLAEHPEDDEFRSLARSTRERLLAGPCVEAVLGDEPVVIALGDEVSIGRSDATIVMPSPVLSRKHLELKQSDQGPIVCDLQSRNGTLLAGARLAGPIAVGAGLDLKLGGQIELRVQPRGDGALRLQVAGQTWLAPLGPMKIGPFELKIASERVQVTLGDSREAPVLNGLIANVPIDLCRGDEIRETRDGPILLKVAGS
ncbi:MAG: FHA domain-containing protein [Deltaproteobacteria bacterium]|nr:FHA domain-containing protein [Deltaproteobacteria bacterium]